MMVHVKKVALWIFIIVAVGFCLYGMYSNFKSLNTRKSNDGLMRRQTLLDSGFKVLQFDMVSYADLIFVDEGYRSSPKSKYVYDRFYEAFDIQHSAAAINFEQFIEIAKENNIEIIYEVHASIYWYFWFVTKQEVKISYPEA